MCPPVNNNISPMPTQNPWHGWAWAWAPNVGLWCFWNEFVICSRISIWSVYCESFKGCFLGILYLYTHINYVLNGWATWARGSRLCDLSLLNVARYFFQSHWSFGSRMVIMCQVVSLWCVLHHDGFRRWFVCRSFKDSKNDLEWCPTLEYIKWIQKHKFKILEAPKNWFQVLPLFYKRY
jgi:hypothetical protein